MNVLAQFIFFARNFILSFVVACISTYFLIKFARKFNIMDNPDGLLKKHKESIPYLGGLGIFIGSFITLGLWAPKFTFGFLFGLVSMFLLGLIDDLRPLTPGQKILGQFIIACFLVYYGFVFKILLFSKIINQILSVFWILSVVNAFNLVDIMDGLCSTISFFAALNFIFFINTDMSLVFININLMGSLLGFFIFNRPSAKIYLGDAGSMFLGTYFALLTLSINWNNYGLFAFLYPILILIIPLLELAWLILIRTYKKIPFYKGSPDHFAIYLQNFGFDKYIILLFVAALNLIIFSIVYFIK